MYSVKIFSFVYLLCSLIVSIDTAALDYFHCKAATCHEFYYGLKNSPRQKEYVNVCYDTVHSLQAIALKFGKCFDETTRKLNPACILALATTMKNCVEGLNGISELHARYFCGYRLMQNCARHIGLERFPYQSEYQRPHYDH